MIQETQLASSWLINGFQTTVVLWCWVAAVLLFGLWRSTLRPEDDPIRPSGPHR